MAISTSYQNKILQYIIFIISIQIMYKNSILNNLVTKSCKRNLKLGDHVTPTSRSSTLRFYWKIKLATNKTYN